MVVLSAGDGIGVLKSARSTQKNAPREKNQTWGAALYRETVRKIRAGRVLSDRNTFAALQLRGAYAGEGAGQAQEHFVDTGLADGEGRGKAQAIGLRGVQQQTFVQRSFDYGVSRIVGQVKTPEQPLPS